MVKEYDEIVSLGSQCNPGLSLRKLNLKGKTYPFDWVCSNSKIVYDVIVNGKKKYITFNDEKSDDYFVKDLDSLHWEPFPSDHVNMYGQYFTHYAHMTTEELAETFSRYIDRFFDLLNSDKKVLFICSHEEYIYHKMARDYRHGFYDYLCKINDHLCKNFPRLNFTILNIDIDYFENYGNIVNRYAQYSFNIIDDKDMYNSYYFDPYRKVVTSVIKEFLDE